MVTESDGRCGAGYRPRWDGSPEDGGDGLERGKALLPEKHGTDLKRLPRHLTSVRLQATVVSMRIRNFVHKGLKKLYAARPACLRAASPRSED